MTDNSQDSSASEGAPPAGGNPEADAPPAAEAPQAAGAEAESAPAEPESAPAEGDTGATEEAESDRQAARDKAMSRAGPDRRVEIQRLRELIRRLDNTITGETKAIGLGLLRQPEFSSTREGIPPLLEKGRAVLGAWDEVKGRRDEVQSLIEEKAIIDHQIKAMAEVRAEYAEEVAGHGKSAGRAAYEAYLADPELQAKYADLFAPIVELDAEIAEKQARKAELEEQKKGGFLSKVKASFQNLTVSVPGEDARDQRFKPIGVTVLTDAGLTAATGKPELQQIRESLAEPLGHIAALDAKTVELSARRDEIESRFGELKGESPSIHARLEALQAEFGRIDAEVNDAVMPLAKIWLEPTPDEAGRSPDVVAALTRLKEASARRSHAETRVARLESELRIEEIVQERQELTQQRHELATKLRDIDRRLTDLADEHQRHHDFVTRVASGQPVKLAGQEVKEELKSVAPAPLEPDKVANAQARARLRVNRPEGLLAVELFGGDGLLFGRSKLDKGRNIRNDWVSRSLPLDAPDASTKTRRVSKVHGCFRGADGKPWHLVDWSTAGLTVDGAKVEKNGWVPLPGAPFMLDIAQGAVLTSGLAFGSDSLLLQRPPELGRWYVVLRASVGLAVQDGRLIGVSPSDESQPGVNILFRDGRFGIGPRGDCDWTINGEALTGPRMLENGAALAAGDLTLQFDALEAGEPAL